MPSHIVFIAVVLILFGAVLGALLSTICFLSMLTKGREEQAQIGTALRQAADSVYPSMSALELLQDLEYSLETIGQGHLIGVQTQV